MVIVAGNIGLTVSATRRKREIKIPSIEFIDDQFFCFRLEIPFLWQIRSKK